LAYPADGPCYSILLEQSVDDPAQRSHVAKFPVTRDVPDSYLQTYTESKIWTAKAYQFQLWTDRRRFLRGERFPGLFYGISAMPSLHVAAVTMIAFFLFHVSTLLGIIGTCYAIVTFIGSIFLQWHYAVDGYIGFIMALLICVIAKKLPPSVQQERW
ncbi:MAG: phosphatase PAP2 family protein, partial [Bdellovibrionales bacterium]|nr:phosphatase PAP2 family protein [Bdellovibrionales bacterium]